MNKNIYNYKITSEILLKISSIMEMLGRLNKLNIINDNWNNLLKKINPFNKNDLLKIRKKRFENDNVFDSNFVFKHSDYNNIDNDINDLFLFLNDNKYTIHPLILYIIIYYNLILIKPFDKYNSKIINVYFQLFLIKYNSYFSYMEIPNNIDINIINNCYIKKDLTSFILYILNNIELSLKKEDNIKEINGNIIKIEKLLKVMEKNKPMSAYEIMNKLNIKSKETFRHSYLDIAIEKGLVQRTIPDKPTSRNQMYYRV